MYTLGVPWLELAWQELQLLEQENRTMNFGFSVSQVEIQLQETMMEVMRNTNNGNNQINRRTHTNYLFKYNFVCCTMNA